MSRPEDPFDYQALEEYKEANSNLRLHAQSRYFTLPILMAVTGGLATIQFGKDTQVKPPMSIGLALLGIFISLMLLIVQHRENIYWHHYLERARELEKRLGFSQLSFPTVSRFLSATVSTYIAFVVVTIFWLVDLGTRLF